MGLILLIKSPTSTSSPVASNTNLYECALDDEEIDFELLNVDSSSGSSSSSEDRRKARKKLNNMHQMCETFVKASFQISILDSHGHKVDKSQSEKQLFELYGSWGYKEYMSASDLLAFKEKYLTHDCADLSLHCKIVLFYTVTVKTNLNESPPVVSFPPIILKDLDPISDMGSYATESQQTKSRNHHQKISPPKECNTPGLGNACMSSLNSHLH